MDKSTMFLLAIGAVGALIYYYRPQRVANGVPGSTNPSLPLSSSGFNSQKTPSPTGPTTTPADINLTPPPTAQNPGNGTVYG